MTFTMFYDPGHAWLRVPLLALRKVGLGPESFSRYSFQDANAFYLEEDCDAPKFVAIWKRKVGPISVKEIEDAHGFVRSLARL